MVVFFRYFFYFKSIFGGVRLYHGEFLMEIFGFFFYDSNPSRWWSTLWWLHSLYLVSFIRFESHYFLSNISLKTIYESLCRFCLLKIKQIFLAKTWFDLQIYESSGCTLILFFVIFCLTIMVGLLHNSKDLI